MNHAIAPLPIVAITLPPALDDRLGRNRASGTHRRIVAEGEVPVSHTLMADFARYPVFHGLPAVMSIASDDTLHLRPAAIYLIVKELFRRAASHQPDAGTDLRLMQRSLPYASIETTGIYRHAEDDRRHAQTTHVPPAPEAAVLSYKRLA